MSNSKNTPGPWEIRRSGLDKKYYSVVDNDGLHVCDCRGNNLGDEWLNFHNAKLIAAAPELLEALRNIIAKYDNDYVWEHPVKTAALAAIKKATE